MTITVIGNDIREIREKIGAATPPSAISITLRCDFSDYTHKKLPGCIVDARWISKYNVPREFENAEDALLFLREILTGIDSAAQRPEDNR